MKTGDETVDSMFDEVVETTIKADGTAQVKRLVSDEETEFAEACDALVAAEKMWAKIDKRAKAQEGIPDNVGEWFDALEARYQADKRLWLLFIGKDRSVRSNRMYVEFSRALLSGKSTRADA
jgi:hypothetical protein